MDSRECFAADRVHQETRNAHASDIATIMVGIGREPGAKADCTPAKSSVNHNPEDAAESAENFARELSTLLMPSLRGFRLKLIGRPTSVQQEPSAIENQIHPAI